MIENGRVPMEPTGMELNERDVVEMVVLEFKRDWLGEYFGPVMGSPSWPLLLSPQAQSVPSLFRATVWEPPATT